MFGGILYYVLQIHVAILKKIVTKWLEIKVAAVPVLGKVWFRYQIWSNIIKDILDYS